MALFDSVDNELATVRNFQDRRRQADQVVSNFTEDQVRVATAIHDFYRYLPPGASLALAAGGYGPDSDVVNRIATNFLSGQSNASLAQYGETIGPEDVSTNVDEGKGRFSPIGRELAKHGVKYDGDQNGFGKKVLSGAKDAASTGWDTLGTATDKIPGIDAVKGATRAADAWGRLPVQAATGYYRAQTASIQDRGLLATARDSFSSPKYLTRTAIGTGFQTDIGQVEAHLASGKGVDTGSGFFLNDRKGIGQARATSESEYGQITYPDGTVHNRTIGRDLAGLVGLEPGTRGYQVVSGFADAVPQIASMKLAGSAAKERQATRAFKGRAALDEGASALERIRDNVGAIRAPGKRLTYDRNIAQAWLDSKEGSTVAEWFSKTASTRDIDRVTGGKLSPAHLAALADAPDVDAAKKVMQEALDSGEIRKQITAVGGVAAPWRRMGIEVKDRIPRFANRAFDIVPDTKIDLTDARATIDEADRWAATVKASEEERNALHDALSRIPDKPQLLGDGADQYRIVAHETFAQKERETAIRGVLRNASERYMENYVKWQGVADDPLAGAAKKAAAQERLTKAKSTIDEVLGYGARRGDEDIRYWADSENQNPSWFGAIVDGADPLGDARTALRSGAPNAPMFDSTGKRLFHGTSERFAGDALTSGKGRSSGNLFGPGLYLTDNPEVASTYMTKGRGKNPVGYAAQWTGSSAPKFFDAEQSAPPAIKAVLQNTLDMLDQADYLNIAQDDWDEVQRTFASGSVADFYKSVKTALAGNRRSDVDEILTELNAAFHQAGFDGMTYAGGLRTGNQTHQAHVLFDTAAATLNGQVIPESFSNIKLHPFDYSSVPKLTYPKRATPGLSSELIGGTLVMPKPKEVRSAFNSPLISGVMKIPGLKPSKSGLEFLMDKVWKPSNLLKPALGVRVIGDEQARILATGGDSVFNHPISLISWMLGDSKMADRFVPESLKRGTGNVLGQRFSRVEDLAGALNNADRGFWNDILYKSVEGHGLFKPGQQGFEDAWHYQLSKLHAATESRLIADMPSLDEAKKVWWDNLGDVREKLAKAHPVSTPGAITGRDLLTAEGAASYLDITSDRLHHITQGNPRLLDAVRTGELTVTDPALVAKARASGGVTKIVDGVEAAVVPMFEGDYPNPLFAEALKAEFGDVAREGFTNKDMVGRITRVDKADTFTNGKYDSVVSSLFAHLLSNPDDMISRSPYARQQYWAEVTARVAHLNPDEVPKLIANAEQAGLPRDTLRTIKRLAGKAGVTGDEALSLDELHHIGAGYAADQTKELLYDLGRRHQLADMVKLIVPFGEAWAEILNVWSKQLVQPRRWSAMSVAARAARSEDAGAALTPGEGSYDPKTGETTQRGLFYKDENGNEMVALPMSRQLMGLLGQPQVPIVGKVKGLSIGTTVMPGLGPVAQIPLAALQDHFQDPKYDWMREALFPFGQPRGGIVGQVTDAVVPAWMKKVLNVNGGYDDRQWSSSVADSMRYLASTGQYKVSGEGASQEEINRLLSDAKSSARTMAIIRGLAQTTSPTAPSYEWAIEDKTGKRISMLTLGRELHDLQSDPDPEVSDNAILTFLQRHGEGAFLLLQGKSIAISPAGGLPPTKEAAAWLFDHKDAQDKYPYAYGLFAPRNPGDQFDSDTYWQQMDAGDREQLDPEVMLKLANQKVAQAVYYSYRNKLGSSISAAQSAWLSNIRSELERQYPGYSANGDDVPGAPVKATRQQVIAQLEQAVKDPKLADSPVTAPLADYLASRASLEKGVGAQSGREESNSWTTAKKYKTVRKMMFDEGTRLAATSPEFRSVWEMVLLPEFDRQLTDDNREG